MFAICFGVERERSKLESGPWKKLELLLLLTTSEVKGRRRATIFDP